MDVEKVTEVAPEVDDDGRVRTGTVWTATTHAITAVIGSGVLALPWSVAQMGWVLGPIALIGCAYITYFTACLLSDCYRSPDPVHGKRNYTYMDAVRSCLGPREVVVCGITQYTILCGAVVGYTITAATGIMSVVRSNCRHYKGHGADCSQEGTMYLVMFGVIEVVLSQLPSLEKVTFVSIVAAVMSFTYSFVALFLSAAKFASNHKASGTIFGSHIGGPGGVSAATRTWSFLQALGNIAFAYTYAMLLIEIQDTVKAPPSENVTMKRASMYGIGVTTAFYVSLGCIGYAAFGNAAPGNILTGFDEPFWLVDLANIAVVIHLVGAYQVYVQPVFACYEKKLRARYPDAAFFHRELALRLPGRRGALRFTMAKLVLRTAFVVATTVVSLMLPFFNAILGLLGAAAFFPLTVYFPVTMYITQAKVPRGSGKWVALQALNVGALVVSLLAAVGSVADIVQRLGHVTMFKTQL
ncbi:amino acid permease 1-like [Triticum dicoccoides]|uniref:Amino acid transporter transmembrane domain-containing protein n=1 Tax=Triticum turgidum subsp. durum TaxID=4567 RepID=A0A9R1QUP6_TRITD|nr:amino acid permease 1-like [Triticum dicoccoides]VAH82509.1 unnamed protein product [Triticum turgidum subsp. durum]